MGTTKFKQYDRTNLSFEEVFGGEYDLPLQNAPLTVLDIGANEGAFTAWAVEKWPKASVIAFEPVPESAALFRANHGKNLKVNFSHLAVANTEKLTMFRGIKNSGECSAIKLGEQSDESFEASCISPKDLPSCEFVKIDTEGMELEILKGLDLSKTKAIAIEYHRPQDRQDMAAYLQEQGFSNQGWVIHNNNMGQERGILKFTKDGSAKVKAPVKVFIAVPSYFMVDPNFHNSLMHVFGWLAAQSGQPNAIHGTVAHSFGDSPHVGRSRNRLTAQFLASDCTDLLFIDSDLVFTVEQVKRVLEHDEEVVGGVYFKKCQGPPEACLNSIRNPIVKDNGVTQVAYIGTGFLRIKREVFEAMIEKFGDEMAYCPDGTTDVIEYNFWNLAMNTFDNIPCSDERVDELVAKHGVTKERASKAIKTRWLSEDWWFCQRCMDMGYKVWADRGIALKHSGNALYPLKTQEEQIFASRKAGDCAGAEKPVSPLAPAPASI